MSLCQLIFFFSSIPFILTAASNQNTDRRNHEIGIGQPEELTRATLALLLDWPESRVASALRRDVSNVRSDHVSSKRNMARTTECVCEVRINGERLHKGETALCGTVNTIQCPMQTGCQTSMATIHGGFSIIRSCGQLNATLGCTTLWEKPPTSDDQVLVRRCVCLRPFCNSSSLSSCPSHIFVVIIMIVVIVNPVKVFKKLNV